MSVRSVSGFDPKFGGQHSDLFEKSDRTKFIIPGTIQGSEACGNNLNVKVSENKREKAWTARDSAIDTLLRAAEKEIWVFTQRRTSPRGGS